MIGNLYFQSNDITSLQIPAVGFYARVSTHLTFGTLARYAVAAGVVIFDDELTDIGSNYDPGTGIFTGLSFSKFSHREAPIYFSNILISFRPGLFQSLTEL